MRLAIAPSLPPAALLPLSLPPLPPFHLSLQTDFKPSLARFPSLSLSPPISPLSPASLPSPTALIVQFHARRQVDVPFTCGSLPPEEYVKNVERVVKVTFPDSARICRLGNSVWRAQLKPVTFFSLSATPVCDISVFHEHSALRISSNKLALDFAGLSDQFKHLDLNFSLMGQLTVSESNALATRTGHDKSFQGWVKLGLKVNLPLPFSLMPQAILTPVGDGILDRILGAMQAALLAGLVRDYNVWCRIESGKHSPSSNVEIIMSG